VPTDLGKSYGCPSAILQIIGGAEGNIF